MYKYYIQDNKIQFYPRAVKINGEIYGVNSDDDIREIKAMLAGDAEDEAAIDAIPHTEIVLEQPTAEQLAVLQSREWRETTGLREYVKSVMDGTIEPTQDEINAMLLLEIAELKAGVSDE